MQVWQTPARQLQRVGTSQASARLSTPPCPVAKAAVMPLRAKVTSGPVPAGPFATESVARARELASHDPLVLAGRLELQVMTWWCPPGTMVTNGLPVHIDG